MLSNPAHAKPQDQFANETPAQQAKHREIERRHQLRRGKLKTNVRLRELERVFAIGTGRCFRTMTPGAMTSSSWSATLRTSPMRS